MKIALYVEDGLEQIVLTPQSDVERSLLGKLHARETDFSIKQGSFYECRGGYVRNGGMQDSMDNDASTMIVLRPKQ